MKNKAIDLHNILFEQLERLNDESIKGEELLVEIKRAEAMNKVAGQITANGRLVLDAIIAKSGIPDHVEFPDMLLGRRKPVEIPDLPKKR